MSASVLPPYLRCCTLESEGVVTNILCGVHDCPGRIVNGKLVCSKTAEFSAAVRLNPPMPKMKLGWRDRFRVLFTGSV